jgi:MFS family permease
MLVGASVFTGIGAACQLTYPLLVMEIVANKYRGWAQGLISLSVLPSLGFGPIVGRAIIESWSWRGTYWVYLALCLLLPAQLLGSPRPEVVVAASEGD